MTEVQVVSPEGSNGETRTNAATSETQRYMGGFWLSQPNIEVSLAGRSVLAARAGGPDNLKLIKGVGPVQEELCHKLGYYRGMDRGRGGLGR